jgi:hypothetical protein
VKSQKLNHPVYQTGLSDFPRTDRVQVKNIWSYPTQRVAFCCLYKHRSRPIVIIINTINQISTFYTFCSSFLVSFSFHQLDLLAITSSSKIIVVHASPPFRCRLTGGGAPHRSPTASLTAIGPDKTEQFTLPNRIIQFIQVSSRRLLFISCANKNKHSPPKNRTTTAHPSENLCKHLASTCSADT